MTVDLLPPDGDLVEDPGVVGRAQSLLAHVEEWIELKNIYKST